MCLSPATVAYYGGRWDKRCLPKQDRHPIEPPKLDIDGIDPSKGSSCLHSLGSVECADTWRIRCQSPKSAMTLRHYKCDVTSLLDRATCFGVVMGGERERGATEGTPCQI